jgi:hypothetical protein
MATPTDSSTIVIAQEDPAIAGDTTTTGNTVYQANGATYVTTVENYNNTFVTTNQTDNPQGPTGAIQYNSNGSLAGVADFSFNAGNGVVTVPSLEVSNRAQFSDANSFLIYGGTSGQTLVTDGLGNINWGSPGGGGNIIAGSNTQIQFNDGGDFGADTFFTYNKSTTSLTAINSYFTNTVSTTTTANTLTTNTVQIGNTAAVLQNSNTFAITASTSSTAANATIHSMLASGVSSVEYHITASDGVSNRKVSRVTAVNLGSVTNFTEYSAVWTTSNFVQFNVVQSLGSIDFQVTPGTANLVTYSIMVTVYN